MTTAPTNPEAARRSWLLRFKVWIASLRDGQNDVPDEPAATATLLSHLSTAVAELSTADDGYHDAYFGHDLNPVELTDARQAIDHLHRAAGEMYNHWREAVRALPAGTEITQTVEAVRRGLRLAGRLLLLVTGHVLAAFRPSGSLNKLVDLNERVRTTTDVGYEALPHLRFMVLHARHYELNCERLANLPGHVPTLVTYAMERRLELETILSAIAGDVDAQRAQASALALYAQTHIALQVRLLNWMLGLITAILAGGAVGVAIYNAFWAK